MTDYLFKKKNAISEMFSRQILLNVFFVICGLKIAV